MLFHGTLFPDFKLLACNFFGNQARRHSVDGFSGMLSAGGTPFSGRPMSTYSSWRRNIFDYLRDYTEFRVLCQTLKFLDFQPCFVLSFINLKKVR